MNLSDGVRINVPQVVHETIEGETIILNLENGNYYSMVGTGGYVWACIEKGATVSDVIAKLTCEYEGEKEEIAAAVKKFVDQLIEEGLAVEDGRGAPEGSVWSEGQFGTFQSEKRLSFDPPVLNKYTDMQDLLLLDPIHEVDETGWPESKPDSRAGKADGQDR